MYITHGRTDLSPQTQRSRVRILMSADEWVLLTLEKVENLEKVRKIMNGLKKRRNQVTKNCAYQAHDTTLGGGFQPLPGRALGWAQFQYS